MSEPLIGVLFMAYGGPESLEDLAAKKYQSVIADFPELPRRRGWPSFRSGRGTATIMRHPD